MRQIAFIALIFISFSAHAEYKEFSSGTGFFVSRSGHIMTNAHVIKPCGDNPIYFRGPNRQPQVAKLTRRRDDLDLALIRSDTFHPNRIAVFRWSQDDIVAGEKVFILGYPEPKDIGVPPTAVESTVISALGPQNEPEYLQFHNIVRHGNSGGPLMDFAGNVIGVVTAKTTLYRRNAASGRTEKISESDVAINMNTIKRFLDSEYVMYQQTESFGDLTARRLEQIAETYTVHVFCEVAK
ncbi:MAG: serine protease [Rickettsiales bacterium]